MTRIISDACCNHLGDRRIMEAMIRAAAEVGVDTIKFQSFRAEKLRKDYPNFDEALKYYKVHELSDDDHLWLMDKCKQYGIGFLTTVFDVDTADFLARIGVKEVKIASPDMMNFELIDECLRLFDHVIISTGMHTKEEISQLEVWLCDIGLLDKVSILYCISKYPTDFYDLNLAGIRHFDGFSDHTKGLDAAKVAIVLGAGIVERHFTLSRWLPGRDQHVSSTPEEFKELVNWREKVKEMMGDGKKELDEEELRNREVYKGRFGG